jgi:uncharacterized membrane protein
MNIRSGVTKFWPVMGMTVILLTFLDVVIDPIALLGERWFLGNIYGYPQPGIYFGVPLVNFAGWAVVGFLSLMGYRWVERRLHPPEPIPYQVVKWELLLGIALYYGVIAFNVGVTFWIGEVLIGIVGCFIFVPLTAVFFIALWRGFSYSKVEKLYTEQCRSNDVVNAIGGHGLRP